MTLLKPAQNFHVLRETRSLIPQPRCCPIDACSERDVAASDPLPQISAYIPFPFAEGAGSLMRG